MLRLRKCHRNDDGAFQEIVYLKDLGEFGQASILEIAPNAERGNHYHLRKKEWFFCTSGTVIISIEEKGDTVTHHTLTENKWQVLPIPIGARHWVSNPSDKNIARLLIFCNEKFDDKDPDTHV